MTNNFTYGKYGLLLTEGFEGVELTAYPDVGGVWTIGYGHTGPNVHKGLTITQAQAEQFLLQDVKRAADAVNTYVTVAISQDEFDALTDFTFNAGTGALEGSTLLKDLNAGNFAGAAAQFDAWDHAGGKVVAGLLRRREAEEKLFEEGENA
jgi:lysozyme